MVHRPQSIGYSQFADGVFTEVFERSGNVGLIFVDGPAQLDGDLNIFVQSGFHPTIGTAYPFLFFTPGELSGWNVLRCRGSCRNKVGSFLR